MQSTSSVIILYFFKRRSTYLFKKFQPGMVNISADTKNLLTSKKYVIQNRGKVKVKVFQFCVFSQLSNLFFREKVKWKHFGFLIINLLEIYVQVINNIV